MTLNQKQNFAQARREKRHNGERSGRKINFQIVNKFLFCLLIIVGAYYVVSINDLAIKGFVLQELKSEVSQLSSENNLMELAIMELESYDNIEKRAQAMNMVKVSKIDYITVAGTSVAKK